MSFRLVEVDNVGFQILDEDGNAVDSVIVNQGIDQEELVTRLAVEAYLNKQSSNVAFSRLVEELKLIRRELRTIRIYMEEITGEELDESEVCTEGTR